MRAAAVRGAPPPRTPRLILLSTRPRRTLMVVAVVPSATGGMRCAFPPGLRPPRTPTAPLHAIVTACASSHAPIAAAGIGWPNPQPAPLSPPAPGHDLPHARHTRPTIDLATGAPVSVAA